MEDRDARLTTLAQRLHSYADIEDVLDRLSEDFRDLHNECDGFEWSEDASAGLDGMASLPASTEAGYLGNSAGSSILRIGPDLLLNYPSSINSREISPSPTRDLRLSGHLANTTILDGLLDAYFACYNPSYPIVHERTFRQQYQERHQIPLHSHWHAVFFAVLAIGNWILGRSSASEQCVYYHAARSRMSVQMLETGSLSTVQLFLLMGNYLQKQDHPNTGYNLIGIAYRMALGLGLHREVPIGKSNLVFHERRRTLWWIAYCFDSGFSLTTCRPVMGSDFIETRLPRNIDDSTCILSSSFPPPTDYPTGYSAIIAQAQLVSIGIIIYKTVISGPPEAASDGHTARSLHHQLEEWRHSLPLYFAAHDIPDWFRGARTIILWKEQNLRMMLWWGAQHLQGNLASETEYARHMCYYVATKCIQNITTYCLDYSECLHPNLSWYATYFLFQASVVLSRCPRPSKNWQDGVGTVDLGLCLISISRARECLADLGRGSDAARRCLEMLDQIQAQEQEQPGVFDPLLMDGDEMDMYSAAVADRLLWAIGL
ncbi:hypothetical protein ASPCADRAFT_43278 [Aspergillus carbonarius ITEM 5010]|uniref:Xylanolytic transcriptional activator regulatory domain-containing protein n=1 Tax=Aspergillus carbonarius (strain ITEM 5010) TaxID=602072 RepID=A0A1R3RUQ3_ASPC5|nr:hypothetical protein ASPCADRAFT_43278 [Aspergillus carbonarius ITEM 5010]